VANCEADVTIENNKGIVRSYVDAFNAFDMERLRNLFTLRPRIYGVLGHGGLDVVEPIWRELHFGMNMRLEIVAMAADGDHVAIRFRETGRFVGPFRGLSGHEPTGRPYEITAMEWFELEGGRIAARWGARDPTAITRQVVG
jgi:predicted ester cyclase